MARTLEKSASSTPGVAEQQLDHRGHEQQVGDPVADNGIQNRGRIDVAQHDGGGAFVQPDQHPSRTGHVEHRHHRQADAVGGEPPLVRRFRVALQR